jgi:Putative metal-binding motif
LSTLAQKHIWVVASSLMAGTLLMAGPLLTACGDGYNSQGADAAPIPCTDSVSCDDGDPCTDDLCDSDTGYCRNPPRDADGDGMGDTACGGFDCDDGDPEVYAGAPERCNGIDDDCDGEVPLEEVDGDGDGFAPCGLDGPASADCNDTALAVHPGSREICGNGIDDNCNSLVDGLDLACGAPPANNTCLTAEPLTLPATLTGSTLAASNDQTASCGDDAPEVVYSFQIWGLWHLTARVDTLDPQFDPLLHLRRECENPGAEVACVDDSDGLNPILSLRAPPSGLYHLFVEGSGTTDVGDFDLTVSATPVVNDLCAAAVDVSAGGVWNSSTAGLTNQYVASCNSSSLGRDAVFFFTLTEPRHAILNLVGTTFSWASLHLQTVCGNLTSELACAYDSVLGTPPRIETDLAAGTYFLFVDSNTVGYEGDYTLTVSFSTQ